MSHIKRTCVCGVLIDFTYSFHEQVVLLVGSIGTFIVETDGAPVLYLTETMREVTKISEIIKREKLDVGCGFQVQTTENQNSIQKHEKL